MPEAEETQIEHEDELLEYDESDNEENKGAEESKDVKKGHYVGIHASGFKDFVLKPELLRAIETCGFEHPSEVQQECIPQAVLGMDVICQAKSGMGKTAVFVLATLNQLEPVDGEVAVLVLCHTRELAYQIKGEYDRFSKFLQSVKTEVFFGGIPERENVDTLKNNTPHVIVGTPGRVLALVKKGHLKLDKLKHFVLDECDKMLEQLDMRRVVQEIFVATPRQKQVMMYSATLSKEIRPVCKKFCQDVRLHTLATLIPHPTTLELLAPKFPISWSDSTILFHKGLLRSCIHTACGPHVEENLYGSEDLLFKLHASFRMRQQLMCAGLPSFLFFQCCAVLACTHNLSLQPLEVFIDSDTKLTLHGLIQYYVKLDEAQKNRKLNDLLDALEFNQVVIFVSKVKRAIELNRLLEECNFPSMCIHSGMKQPERIEKYQQFKDFKKRILVTTDLFGRGIDIERVNIVINYDFPRAHEGESTIEDGASDQYLHRVGRAGRFGTKGLAISFIGDQQDADGLAAVQSRFEVDIQPLPDQIDINSYMSQRRNVFKAPAMNCAILKELRAESPEFLDQKPLPS